ncbi:hypothetical protein Ga0061061_101328 [Chelatococcus sambhunathii]|uniref:Uncharacterized protein n=2 Tax=Chelatococcaceae TaxID=2036754 RepID=A0ABP1ZYJ3_9HYPH|nr:hypothetical protein Ga0061061_101328 [Chelatococcus sambhunathii]
MALCSVGHLGQAPGTGGPPRAGLCRLGRHFVCSLILGCIVLPAPLAGAQDMSRPPAHGAAGHSAAPGAAAPLPLPCTCRAKGRDYELGEVVCLPTSAGPRLATCGMELNNTSWHVTSEPCPDS